MHFIEKCIDSLIGKPKIVNLGGPAANKVGSKKPNLKNESTSTVELSNGKVIDLNKQIDLSKKSLSLRTV